MHDPRILRIGPAIAHDGLPAICVLAFRSPDPDCRTLVSDA